MSESQRPGDLTVPGATGSAEEFRTSGAAIGAWSEGRAASIVTATVPRTVQGILLPVDRLLTTVTNLATAGSLVFSVHPEAETREAARRASELANQALSRLLLDRALYDAVEAIPTGSLAPAEARAREKLLLQMRRAGVRLGAPEREELQRLSDAIDETQNQYMENLANRVRTVEVDDPARLAGLPEDYRAKHAPGADGKIRLTTSYPDALPVVTYADDPDLRRKMVDAFSLRAYPENTSVLGRLRELRWKYAQLLGYPNFATYIIEDKMMQKPEAAWVLVDRVDGLLRPPADRDRARIEAKKAELTGKPGPLRPEDVAGGMANGYYEEKQRVAVYGVDTKALRAYFPYATVRTGLFGLCEELFGLRIVPTPQAPVWHPSVDAFEVRRDGVLLGRFGLDMVPREGKYNHAAQFDLRVGVEGLQLPEAVLVCNFVPSISEVSESLMSYSDVVTFFHEFGHLLHAIFAGHTPFLLTSNAWIETDFVEAPSMLFEEWARDAALLTRIGRHFRTGEPLPREIAERLVRSGIFGRALHWRSQVAYSAASLAMYERDPAGSDPAAIMSEMLGRFDPFPRPSGGHMECGWGHLTGYSALYYTYTWSLVIARDLLGTFYERGSLLDPELARRYAERILSPGGSRPPAELVRDFLGREPEYRAFERWMTLDPSPAAGASDRS